MELSWIARLQANFIAVFKLTLALLVVGALLFIALTTLLRVAPVSSHGTTTNGTGPKTIDRGTVRETHGAGVAEAAGRQLPCADESRIVHARGVGTDTLTTGLLDSECNPVLVAVTTTTSSAGDVPSGLSATQSSGGPRFCDWIVDTTILDITAATFEMLENYTIAPFF